MAYADSYNDAQEMLTKPICERWKNMLRTGVDARQEFRKIHDQCQAFYFSTSRFLWEDDHRKTFLGPDAPVPMFQVTVNKAFEYIAIFAPMLCWQNPDRSVTSVGKLDMEQLGPKLQPLFEQDPQFQMLAQQQQQSTERDAARNAIWEAYFAHTADEQPDGGLRGHAQLSIQDYLLSGRGVLMPRTYGPPESDRTLTGLFHVPVRRLLIDPDSTHPHAGDAQWLSVTHYDAYWEVENRFRLKPGSLKGKGQLSSMAGEVGRWEKNTQYSSSANDIICWNEIWTRCGVGARYSGESTLPMGADYEELVGDYAYLCVSESCNYPLNLPGRMLLDDNTTDDDVKRALSWPVEYWRDNRWPLAFLDYFPNRNTPWPIAPLAVVIGEMVCLQILLSIYLGNAHANSQQIVACLKSYASKLQDQLKKGANPCVVEIDEEFNKSVTEVIQFLQRPEMNTNILEAMQFLMDQIERKTGLSELLYGRNPGGTQSRSAADISAKQEQVNIRPEFMGNEVADFISRASDLERICAYKQIQPADVEPALGPLGAYLWQNLILADDEDTAIRGLRCRVEAIDLKRPNKQRDGDNLKAMLNFLVPAMQEYGAANQNYEPFNGFLKAMGRAMEVDVTEFLFPPPQPPDPEMADAQKRLLQAEVAEKEGKAAQSNADAQATTMEAQISAQATQQGAQVEAMQAQHGMGLKEQETAAKLGMQQEQGQAKLALQQQDAQSKLGLQQQDAAVKMQLQAAQGQQKLEAGEQSMEHSDQLHREQMVQNSFKFAQDQAIKKMQAEASIAATKAKASAPAASSK